MAVLLQQVDVFTAEPYLGNPVAVVFDADHLSTEQMQTFARWTNLSETTFLVAPTDPAADYRVRIFTPSVELPFAGHPTLGTCHAWLRSGGTPATEGTIVQECGAGLITLRRDGGRLAFAAPPLTRSGPVDEADLERAADVLGIGRDEIVDSAWCDNGPGWMAVMLDSVDKVLSIRPSDSDLYLGVAALKVGVVSTPASQEPAIEVRAFFPKDGSVAEDPVTGSLNAALAQWLLGTGRLTAPYVASQGTALGRAGRVHVTEADGEIWVGGDAVTCIEGTVQL